MSEDHSVPVERHTTEIVDGPAVGAGGKNSIGYVEHTLKNACVGAFFQGSRNAEVMRACDVGRAVEILAASLEDRLRSR